MLVQKDQVAVAIFNMQLEIVPLLEDGTNLLTNCCWLADVCRDLSIPHLVVEHKKLGKSSEALKEVATKATYVEKTYFDFLAHQDIRDSLESTQAQQIVLAGAETHVCLLQSALQLKAAGKTVFVLSDTCSARNQADHDAALARLQQHGIELITREMFFFELIRFSEYPQYLDLAMKFLDGRYIR